MRTIEQEIEHMKFKMDLIFENTDFDRYIYETDITKQQLDEIYNIMKKYDDKIFDGKGDELSSSTFENEVLNIVDRERLDYHFCETFSKLCWEEGRFSDVFPTLYGSSIKFNHLFKK